ncbi:DUF2782 domain-containing protein [Stenotrophomonas sp. NPDC077464]|uniref:DUF2782 domain-containing protein n=1 Tax=unclassified Stenotrophomonas TaxID=196198 RepID=UPI0037D1A024
MKTLMLAGLLVLAGCATTGGSAGAPPVDVTGADIAKRVMDNGDTIEEYRVAGQLRMVKVTPSRGAPYYMYEGGQTGGDRSRDGVSPVYWKLYSW